MGSRKALSGPPRLDHGGELELAGGPDAALLLHGLTGSTFELHPLVEPLHRAGMHVLAPVMAGHGGSAEALRGLPWGEWVAKAARDLQRLDGARRTFLVGCSMGALVACALAHAAPERVHGLVLLAPALRLRPWGRVGAWLGRRAVARGLIVSKGPSDVSDPEMRRRNRGLPGVPLGAVAQLEALAAHVDQVLPALRVPTLVLMGGRDHTAARSGARRLARRLGSGPGLRLLPQSFHLLAIDLERERCVEETVRFLGAIGAVHHPGGGPARATNAPPRRE